MKVQAKIGDTVKNKFTGDPFKVTDLDNFTVTLNYRSKITGEVGKTLKLNRSVYVKLFETGKPH